MKKSKNKSKALVMEVLAFMYINEPFRIKAESCPPIKVKPWKVKKISEGKIR